VNFRQLKEEELGFQIAPLIDIVFLLLVFFVATTAFQAMEKEQDIALPGSRTSKAPSQPPPEVIINITREGKIIVNRTPWELSKLREHLLLLSRASQPNPPPVIIRADRQTYYENVIDVFDACVAANLRTIKLATVE